VGEFAAEIAAGAREAGLSRSMITRDPEAAATSVAEWSSSGDWILVKASRGVRLERAVEALQAKLTPGAGKPAS
jgi:UDP-N-acetylmuramoyl-tripeptide--D-alanyl-D-alanine ligase